MRSSWMRWGWDWRCALKDDGDEFSPSILSSYHSCGTKWEISKIYWILSWISRSRIKVWDERYSAKLIGLQVVGKCGETSWGAMILVEEVRKCAWDDELSEWDWLLGWWPTSHSLESVVQYSWPPKGLPCPTHELDAESLWRGGRIEYMHESFQQGGRFPCLQRAGRCEGGGSRRRLVGLPRWLGLRCNHLLSTPNLSPLQPRLEQSDKHLHYQYQRDRPEQDMSADCHDLPA